MWLLSYKSSEESIKSSCCVVTCDSLIRITSRSTKFPKTTSIFLFEIQLRLEDEIGRLKAATPWFNSTDFKTIMRALLSFVFVSTILLLLCFSTLVKLNVTAFCSSNCLLIYLLRHRLEIYASIHCQPKSYREIDTKRELESKFYFVKYYLSQIQWFPGKGVLGVKDLGHHGGI